MLVLVQNCYITFSVGIKKCPSALTTVTICCTNTRLSLTIIIFNDGQDMSVQELDSREISGVSIGTVHLQVNNEALTKLRNGICYYYIG